MAQFDESGVQDAPVFRWTFDGFEFDELAWTLTCNGAAIEIEHRPLEVLACLLRHAGEVVTKEELLNAAWTGRVVVEGALTNAIGKLRKALSDDEQERIVTVARVGYRLNGKIERKAITRRSLATRLSAGDGVPLRPNWKLDRTLDHSDRGEVWLAVHTKTQESRVFKFSFDGLRLGALKREATISRLLHDSLGDRADLVRVVDWNFEDAPYFIESEYGGPSLEAWSQEDKLEDIDLESRIKWLAEVADVVAAAHEVGVLHKDIKPANILVRGDVGDLHPRLVDFGSGRVLDPTRLEQLGITRLGLTQTQDVIGDELTGTLQYLAPELLAGQVPTVRSDVYALGVILFQLCVGDLRRPLSPGWENEIADELLREDIAAAANGNPELRPASARDLAELLRHRKERRLAQETAKETLQRIARSEKALAAARAKRPWLIAAFTALAIGLVTTWTLYREVTVANAKASSEGRIAKAVNQFLNHDMLTAANPILGGRVDITVREALDRAIPQIGNRFAGDPSAAAAVYKTVGNAYFQMSEFDTARVQFEKAANLLAKAEGDESPATVEARLLQATALVRSVKLDEARAVLDAQQDAVAVLADETPMLRVQSDIARAWLAYNSLNIEDAVAPLEDAARVLAGIPDADPNVVSTVEQGLISARSRLGKPAESLELTQQRLLAKMEIDKGRSAPLTLGARHLLARLQVLRGKGREMEQTYLDLVKDFNRVLGPENESSLLAMHGLANIYTKLERWEDCERVGRLAYEGLQRRVGPNHISTLNALNSLAVAQLRLGKLDEAAAGLNSGIKRLDNQSGTLKGLLRAAFQLNLAHVRLAQDRPTDASVLVDDITENGGSLINKDTDAKGELAYLDGCVKLAAGDRSAAAARLRESIDLLSQDNPEEYWIIVKARDALSQADSSPDKTVSSTSRD